MGVFVSRHPTCTSVSRAGNDSVACQVCVSLCARTLLLQLPPPRQRLDRHRVVYQTSLQPCPINTHAPPPHHATGSPPTAENRYLGFFCEELEAKQAPVWWMAPVWIRGHHWANRSSVWRIRPPGLMVCDERLTFNPPGPTLKQDKSLRHQSKTGHLTWWWCVSMNRSSLQTEAPANPKNSPRLVNDRHQYNCKSDVLEYKLGIFG